MHLADLVKWLREALLAARRGPVVHRATNAARVNSHGYAKSSIKADGLAFKCDRPMH